MSRVKTFCCLLLMSVAAGAQEGPPPDRDWRGIERQPPPPPSDGAPRRPSERGHPGGPRGRWWSDPSIAQKLGLNADQQKHMEDLFQQNRVKLIDLTASLEREEAMLDPLLAADRLDESKVFTQIDRVAQARAELEKADARMLFGFRGVLTVEQWKKLQQTEIPRPPQDGHR